MLRPVEPERLDFDGAVIWGVARTWSAKVTAYGSRDGSPFLVSIAETGELCPASFPGNGRVTCVAGWERTLVSVEADRSPRHYEVSTPDDVPLATELIEDEFTRAAARLWVTCGDEDPGYVVLDPDGWVRAADPNGEGWLTSPRALRAASLTTPLSVNMSETTAYVGGLLAEGDARPEPSVYELHQDAGEHGARRLARHIAFDGVTDISDGWDPCIGGHREGRPLVVTVGGNVLPVPAVELDPESPTVIVATSRSDADSDDRMMLVVQAVHRIELWTRSTNGWQSQDLPGDTLHAARYDSESSTLWFVTDNQLWHLLT
jgi:hypothetical protein